MISIKQLHYALAVARRLHFKKAADDCFVSPSTLSNAITELENQIGFKIFERTNKKVLVTKLGEELLEKAKQIQFQIEDINKLGETQKIPLSTSLKIGIIPTIGPYLLPLVLPKLKHDYPKLHLRVIEGQSSALVKKVLNGDLDLAVLALPYDLDGLLAFRFWEENFYYVTYKNNKHKISIKAKEINRSELMLLDDGHCLKNHVLAACKINDKKPFSMEASSLTTLVQLVANNMGSTLVPHMSIKHLTNTNPLINTLTLNEPGPHRELAIIVRPTYSNTENVLLLKEIFRSELEKYSKQ
ncbi:MAG: hydrogen peroxide-inducible genes activator [Proteobacteria bacterium]|jgi:LysR family hydrogen peroxide-inducible transcriptional activator|uniref:Hydrogen peroxide-inducible genes activator n=1 Tax=SAR86 cluster bacterium TaxID=2030880 RepID=A0A937IA03_9GAMM|nr:hydrogen peroxide-inducible genes activator [SAR86 cluster bacterium]MDA0774917.1 hydrogen peroxide-inducible genes activator [Pseudomonadota bacterium]MDA0976220.1 hydrogen peroxide-inducible genes activator [Pseudomonadota bacterium]MDA1036948.1 hydrogen peroxide-inducible genes activator [Pseudomonadota bacterium]